MKSYPTPPAGMSLSQPMCHIVNHREKPIYFQINAGPMIDLRAKEEVFERVPTLSLGDGIAYAIEPKPDYIEINGDITRMEYR